MKNLTIQLLTDVAQHPKIASIASTATMGSGIATYFRIMPEDIGVIATIAGFILSIVLIITHIIKNKRDKEKDKRDKDKHDLEMKILRRTYENAKQMNRDTN